MVLVGITVVLNWKLVAYTQSVYVPTLHYVFMTDTN